MVKKKSEKKHGQGERKRKPSTWKLTRRRKYSRSKKKKDHRYT
jgi:hypothetical protein